jgi:hypothetical protein
MGRKLNGSQNGLGGTANRKIVTAAVNQTLVISLRAIKHNQVVITTILQLRIVDKAFPIYIQNTGHAACDGK